MQLPFAHFSAKQMVMIGAGVAIVIVFGVLIWMNIIDPPPTVDGGQLVVWGVLDPAEFRLLQDEYERARGGTTIIYNQVDEGDYHKFLVNALASGRSPDVFMIKNTWVPQYQDRLVPMPNDPSFTLKNPLRFRETFPQVVEEDFIRDGEIYGLPVNLDTLVLLYNKDLFDSAAIVSPPRTWQEFQDAVLALRTMVNAQLTRPGAAIGGSLKTVAHASDLVALLMLQNGSRMTDVERARAALVSGRPEAPEAGLEAFTYYLQFANAGSLYYTWNENQAYSLDALREGRLAMAFGYLSDFEELERSSKAHIVAARAPQPQGSEVATDYARYWGFSVSRLSPSPEAAWDFVSFISTHAERFLAETGKVPATLPLLKLDVNDFRLSPFAEEALTARSWYQPDDEVARAALSDAIADVVAGRKTPRAALTDAERRINDSFHELLTR